MKKESMRIIAALLWAVSVLILCAGAVSADGMIGDVNGDGAVGGKDATLIRRYLAGGYGVSVDSDLADVDEDGAVTGKDVTLIRRHLVGGYTPSRAGYADVTVDLKNETSRYKTYGRCYLKQTGVVMLWPGNAVEFTAECQGDVTLSYSSQENGYLRTYVDGEEHARPRITSSGASVTVASDLPAGVHTIRVVRDSDISKTNQLMIWKSFSFFGRDSSVTAPAEKDLLIEYVGDSITSGKGVFSDGGVYTTDDPAHAATYAYAYLSAQAMDADWILTSRGGIGYLRTTADGGSCPKTMAQCYDYVNPFAADEDQIPYDFARKADVVVLALGTNDSAKGETFRTAVKSMIARIREKNGRNVTIVIQYGMMTAAHADELAAVASEEGVYSLQVTRDNSGGSSSASGTKHPGAAGQARIAEELTAFLKTIL